MAIDRLRYLIAMTFTACCIPFILPPSLAQQALAQFHARYPLVGCAVPQENGSTWVHIVGRN